MWEVLNASEVFGMYTGFAAGARIMIYFAYCYFVCVCVCVNLYGKQMTVTTVVFFKIF